MWYCMVLRCMEDTIEVILCDWRAVKLPSENLKIQQHEKLLSELKKIKICKCIFKHEQWPCVNIKLYLLIIPVVVRQWWLVSQI